jgi:hypothetical protein
MTQKTQQSSENPGRLASWQRMGFANLSQELRMKYVYEQRIGEPLPKDWWHPTDFYARFLKKIPRGEWSKYRATKRYPEMNQGAQVSFEYHATNPRSTH